MTAAAKQESARDRAIRRLQDVAIEAERAADEARSLIADIEDDVVTSLGVGELDEDQLYELRELPQVVRRHHDAEHAGPFQWCGNLVCRKVTEAGLA